mmetsp:Transcript_924/g.2149  ORF Transcript_924/g.2149 Transcript_924/m.2149 type:complete len:231 (-) Transcript_924:156-848(-)
MTINRIASGLSLLLLFLLEIEAFKSFNFHLRSRKFPLNVKNAKDQSGWATELESHHQRFHGVDDECQSSIFGSTLAPHKTDRTDGITGLNSCGDAQSSRNQFLLDCRARLTVGLAASAIVSWSSFPEASNAKLYSENAANLERINSGDFSGGAVFNNSPDTERAKKRRAMTGCKVALSREEASANILKRTKMMSEKECNTMVMDGETEFMLQALRNLDCPTCANGIGRVD